MAWIYTIPGNLARVNHAGVLVNDIFYVFGGYSQQEKNDDLFRVTSPIDVHSFNLKFKKWSKVPLASTFDAPYMRYGHTVVSYRDSIYLWGGRNDFHVCGKLYRYDIQKSLFFKEKTNGNGPPPRDGHSACVIGNKMYLFGGYNDHPVQQFGEGVYALNLDTHFWSRLVTTGNDPSYRDFHAAVTVGTKMYIFGGRSNEYYTNRISYPNDMQIFDSETNHWSVVELKSNLVPVGRRSHSLFVHGSCIYLFGGFNCLPTGEHYNDLWKFSIKDEVWHKVFTIGIAPSPRRRMTCFIHNNYAYFYGGTAPILPNFPVHPSDPDINLHELSELCILEIAPSLVTLCSWAVLKFKLNYDEVPAPLAMSLRRLA